MYNKVWKKNEFYTNILDKWRKMYCFVIPIILSTLYLFWYFFKDFKLWESTNFSSTLQSVITFISISISFFGVLLTMLISAKEKSQLIKFFLDTADKQDFISSIKKLIMYGLLTVILAAFLFLTDILSEKIIIVVLAVGIYALIRFTALTYRFTNILLMLFVNDKYELRKKEGEQLSADQTKELKDRIKNGI